MFVDFYKYTQDMVYSILYRTTLKLGGGLDMGIEQGGGRGLDMGIQGGGVGMRKEDGTIEPLFAPWSFHPQFSYILHLRGIYTLTVGYRKLWNRKTTVRSKLWFIIVQWTWNISMCLCSLIFKLLVSTICLFNSFKYTWDCLNVVFIFYNFMRLPVHKIIEQTLIMLTICNAFFLPYV